MSAIPNYLNELYLYEDIKYIDENFASWAKQLTQKKIVDKLKLAVQRKDVKMVEKIMSTFPKVSSDKLLKIGKREDKNFKRAYLLTRKEVAKNFPKLTGEKKEYFSIALTPFIVKSEDMKNAKEKIRLLKKKSLEPQYKKFNEGGEGFIGMLFLLISGGFTAASLSTLTMFPLLVGIVIAAFAILLVGQGVAG